MKQFLILISAIFVFASCNKSEDKPVSTQAKRTVIVYMSAENNLSNFADMDTTEMIVGSKSIGSDCNFLAFLDKATKSEKPSIWKYKFS